MIYTAVIDLEPKRREWMNRFLFGYSIQRDYEIYNYLFTSQESVERKDVLERLNMALIAAPPNGSSVLGESVYRVNPECRILYYGPKNLTLRPLLRARPIVYHALPEGREALEKALDVIMEEVTNATGQFFHKSRNDTLLFRTRDILYFQSDLKQLQIHLVDGSKKEITAKLSDVELRLRPRFLRVHQSYLVNPDHIRTLDRKRRSIFLVNSEEIPISNARYDGTKKEIDRICGLES